MCICACVKVCGWAKCHFNKTWTNAPWSGIGNLQQFPIINISWFDVDVAFVFFLVWIFPMHISTEIKSTVNLHCYMLIPLFCLFGLFIVEPTFGGSQVKVKWKSMALFFTQGRVFLFIVLLRSKCRCKVFVLENKNRHGYENNVISN